MKDHLQRILVSPTVSVKDVMEILTAVVRQPKDTPTNLVLVVTKRNKLLGTVTDGDIRRAVTRGIDIDEPVENIMNTHPITVRRDITSTEMLRHIAERLHARKVASKKGVRQTITQVVVTDKRGAVLDVLPVSNILEQSSIKEKHVCIIGLGYIGLTLGLVCADVGFSVFGYERNETITRMLRKGESHVHETGLKTLLKHHLNKKFTVLPKVAGLKGDIYIVCVGTPIAQNKKVLLDDLRNAVSSVGKALKPHDLVFLRSTLPIGVSREVVVPILEKESSLRAGVDFYVAFTPERTLAGKALEELRTLPQIVGGFDEGSARLASSFFKHITQTIIQTSSLEAAESVKLFNNSFRDLTFAYANEMTQLCNRLGLDVVEVIKAANEGYPRNPIPLPSPGVGGYCLVKDPYILSASAERTGEKVELPRISRSINTSMISFVVGKVRVFCKKHKKKNPKIFVVGIAFKGTPETTDTRGSTALDIIGLLKKSFPDVVVYDPVVDVATLSSLGLRALSPQAGFKNADCVLFLNNHHSYYDLDIYTLLSSMKKPGFFFDGWNMFTKHTIDNVSGVTYSTLSS